MSRKIILPLALLLSVALVAGCVNQLSSISGFGSDVITPSRTLTSGTATDIILIDRITSSPESTVNPEQTVRVFMTASSREIDPRRTTSVQVQLFDAFVFKSAETQPQLCNAIPSGCTSVQEQCTALNKCTFATDQTRQIQWVLLAPTTAEIANIATRGTLAYRLLYDYSSSTNFDVLIVSEDEILRLQQQGQTLSVPLQETRGSGPIILEFSQASAFALPKSTLFITVKAHNVGSGGPLNSTIGVGNLTVEIPTSLTSSYYVRASDFTCSPAFDKTVCTNKEKIQLIKKESIPFLFELQNVVPDLAVPHRTFTLSATVSYNYEIRNSLTLTIQPLLV
jgi:predicted small secreted protein